MIKRLDSSGEMFAWGTGKYVNYQDLTEMIKRKRQAYGFSSNPNCLIRIETCNEILLELGEK